MAILRSLVFLTVVCGVALFGLTVPIGNHTLFGHFQRIWNTAETQELVKSVKEEAGPALERAARGLRAGFEEASKPNHIPSEALLSQRFEIPAPSVR